MKKRKYFRQKILAAFSFILGLIFIQNSFSKITGFAVSNGLTKTGSSFYGFILISLGVLLFMGSRLEKSLRKLKGGAVITDSKKWRKIAKSLGYTGREVKEGYEVLNSDGKPLTVIPHRHISTGVSHNISRALYSGESNFRKYNYAH